MKKWHWILLAVLAYLIFLVVYIPAIYVTDYLQKATQNKLGFYHVSGTLFSAKADLITYEGLRLNNVKWQLSPLYLLMLKANLDITGGDIRQPEQIYVKGRVKIPLLNTNNMMLKDTKVFMPAKPLLAQVKLPVPITASGRFTLNIKSFEFDQGCRELSATGNWLKAAVNVNNKPLDLGTFDAVLSCQSPLFSMKISPDNGIQLDANINLELNGKYSAKGQFVIPSNFPEEIKQGAQFFGSSKGQGVYELNL